MSPADSLSSSIKVSKLLYKTTFFVFIESSAKGPIYHDGYIRSYIPLARKRFLNAKIVLDRFHISHHLGRVFLKTRFQLWTIFFKKALPFRALKKHWRIFQKEVLKLSLNSFHSKTFRQTLITYEVVEKTLDFSGEERRWVLWADRGTVHHHLGLSLDTNDTS